MYLHTCNTAGVDLIGLSEAASTNALLFLRRFPSTLRRRSVLKTLLKTNTFQSGAVAGWILENADFR